MCSDGVLHCPEFSLGMRRREEEKIPVEFTDESGKEKILKVSYLEPPS
jgi:hypothetical protein